MRLREFLCSSVLLILTAAPAVAGDPNLLGVGLGFFDETFFDPRVAYFRVDYNRPHYPATDMRFEAVSGYNILPTPEIYGRIHPSGGFEIMSSAATWMGGGLAYDVNYGPFHITPKFEPGLYLPGDGKRLNYPLEFRSSLEFAWEFSDRSRFGVDLSHLSNGQLSEKYNHGKANPGGDLLLIYYRFPLEWWLPG